MPKVLTDRDLCNVIHRAVICEEIDDGDSYKHFLEDLGTLVADHFGGERGPVEFDEVRNEYTVLFHINDCVPEDGGVYSRYCADVQWVGGEELLKEPPPPYCAPEVNCGMCLNFDHIADECSLGGCDEKRRQDERNRKQ